MNGYAGNQGRRVHMLEPGHLPRVFLTLCGMGGYEDSFIHPTRRDADCKSCLRIADAKRLRSDALSVPTQKEAT